MEKVFTVGQIIRLRAGEGFAVWKVTGVHYSGMGTEDLISLRRLDLYCGTAHGTVMTESVVPLAILRAIEHLGVE